MGAEVEQEVVEDGGMAEWGLDVGCVWVLKVEVAEGQ